MLNQKYFIYLIGFICVFVLGIILLNIGMGSYSIIMFTLSFVLLVYSILLFYRNINPTVAYENKIKSILNTYDSVLLRSNNIPNFKEKNIMITNSFDDIIDAQLVIKKPICYFKQVDSCSFFLVDDEFTYVYIEKLNNSIKSPLEIEIKNATIKSKEANAGEEEVLEGIVNTTIIELPNNKSFKVSPIREEELKEIDQIKTIRDMVDVENDSIKEDNSINKENNIPIENIEQKSNSDSEEKNVNNENIEQKSSDKIEETSEQKTDNKKEEKVNQTNEVVESTIIDGTKIDKELKIDSEKVISTKKEVKYVEKTDDDTNTKKNNKTNSKTNKRTNRSRNYNNRRYNSNKSYNRKSNEKPYYRRKKSTNKKNEDNK